MSEPQQVDFQGSDKAWPKIEELFEHIKTLPEPGTPQTIPTPRQIDEAQPAGHRVYMQSRELLDFAYELHRAFLAHIESVFRPRSPFILLRPVLESSLWVLWLLDSPESEIRRERALRYQIQDTKAEIAFLETLGKRSNGETAREAAEQRKTATGKLYREDAERMGLKYADLKSKKINLTDEIPKMQRLLDRHGKDTAHLIVAAWRLLSGYQHGKSWSTYLGSERTFLQDTPGGKTFRIVASDDNISFATGMTALVFIEALYLYIERCENMASVRDND